MPFIVATTKQLIHKGRMEAHGHRYAGIFHCGSSGMSSTYENHSPWEASDPHAHRKLPILTHTIFHLQ